MSISRDGQARLGAEDGRVTGDHHRRGRRRRGAARTVAVGLVLVLAAAGCRDSNSASTSAEGSQGSSSAISNQTATAGAFGDVNNVCQPGSAKGATSTGVTDTNIQLGTISDYGFTQVREFFDAAEAFTSWCNDAGGINGRKLSVDLLDTKIFEYRQRVLEACPKDFLLVGGGGAFDDSGVNDRLTCTLPEMPAQVVSSKNRGSDLQVLSYANYNPKISPYEGYFKWLTKEKFPDTAQSVGLIVGDVGVTKEIAKQTEEVMNFLGDKVVYNEVYPVTGASDWTPYAQAIKSSGTKGLVFFGDYVQLAKLEQSLTDINYKLDWIDANGNSYNKSFLDLTGASLDQHANFVPSWIFPIEKASENPATKQLVEIMAKYKPDAPITAPMVYAWSAWTLFATAARDCGSNLTRTCVLEKATTSTGWTGGGLHGPVNVSDKASKRVCWLAEKGSPEGWTSVDPGANEKVYRCEDNKLELKGDYGKPAKLADVGKSASDVK